MGLTLFCKIFLSFRLSIAQNIVIDLINVVKVCSGYFWLAIYDCMSKMHGDWCSVFLHCNDIVGCFGGVEGCVDGECCIVPGRHLPWNAREKELGIDLHTLPVIPYPWRLLWIQVILYTSGVAHVTPVLTFQTLQPCAHDILYTVISKPRTLPLLFFFTNVEWRK